MKFEKVRKFMEEEKQMEFQADTERKIKTLERKIGKTTYEVSLHFSQTSKERMSDKVMRLLEYDISIK